MQNRRNCLFGGDTTLLQDGVLRRLAIGEHASHVGFLYSWRPVGNKSQQFLRSHLPKPLKDCLRHFWIAWISFFEFHRNLQSFLRMGRRPFQDYSDPICQDNFLPCLRWMTGSVEQAFQPV
jgi:hypothetical protein